MENDLKTKIHYLVDKIEDEHVLQMVMEDITAYTVQGKQADEALTEEQVKEIEAGFSEIESGEYVTYEEFKNKMEEWKKR